MTSFPGAYAAALATLAVQPDPGPIPPAGGERDLQVTLLAGAWMPRLGGRSALGLGAGEIDFAGQLDLHDLEPTLNLELTLRRSERWELLLGGADFSTAGSGRFVGSGGFGGIALADGDPFSARFDLTTVFGELAFSTWRPFTSSPQRIEELENRTADSRYVADLHIAPVVGVRYIDVDQTLSASGSRADGGGEWAGVYGGLQITLDYRPDSFQWLDMLRLQGSLGVGPALGGDGGFMWQVRGGMTLQLTENFGVMVGYRLLELDVESDDYTLDGGLQGLFLAGSLRF